VGDTLRPGGVHIEPAVAYRKDARQVTWPPGVPVQVHGMHADPFFVEEGDIDAAREVVEAAEQGELFLYPGDQHYFADSSLPSYDESATKLLTQRVLAFLADRV
jgi:dienelactone hydrolase